MAATRRRRLKATEALGAAVSEARGCRLAVVAELAERVVERPAVTGHRAVHLFYLARAVELAVVAVVVDAAEPEDHHRAAPVVPVDSPAVAAEAVVAVDTRAALERQRAVSAARAAIARSW